MGGHPEIGDVEKIRQQRLQQRLEVEHQKRVEAWPVVCQTCFAGVGEPCVSMTGNRAVRHKGRNSNG